MTRSRSEAIAPTIDAHLGAELVVEGETWPVFIWTIDHPAGRVLADARSRDDYTIREWVDIRLLPAPSHSDGHQIVVVESDAGTTVIAG